jgi:hypothetical protein
MGALRVGRLAEYLLGRGHDVRVVSARDLPWRQTLDQNFPEERVIRTPWWDINAPPRSVARLRNRLRRARAPAGDAATAPPVDATVAGGGSGNGGILRTISKLYMNLTNWPDESLGWYPSATRAGRRMIAEDRPDLVLASGPPFTTLAIGRSLAVHAGIPWIPEFRDRWWDDPYYQTSKLRTAGERSFERWLVNSAAGIVTVSEPWAEDYRRRYGKPTLTVYNGYELENVAPESPGATETPDLVIVYTGIIYPGRRDPTPLFAALRMMEQPGNVRVRFYGCAPEEVMPLAERQEVGHLVDVCPPVPHREAVALQRRADILLLMQWDNPGEQGNVPGKLFEYLAARRPILAHGNTQGVPARIIRERDAGLYSNEPGEIARQLSRWLKVKRDCGVLPALPESVRRGFSRAEQFALLEAFFAKASPAGASGGHVRSAGNVGAPDVA